jgi:hypothetical protein
MLVLLPLDGSPASLHAAQLIARYRGERAALTPVLLNVQHPPLSTWPHPGLDQHLVETALLEQGAQHLEQGRSILADAGFTPEAVIRIGNPPSARAGMVLSAVLRFRRLRCV